jgi:predicted alpha/beta superfamily hydrolase
VPAGAAASTVTGDLRVLRVLRGLPGPAGPESSPDRDILVHLPAGALASGRRYPVLYLRDALAASGLHEPETLRHVEEPDAIHHESAWARRLPDALRFLFGPGPVDGG